jgi:hypothetical protein
MYYYDCLYPEFLFNVFRLNFSFFSNILANNSKLKKLFKIQFLPYCGNIFDKICASLARKRSILLFKIKKNNYSHPKRKMGGGTITTTCFIWSYNHHNGLGVACDHYG